MRVANDFLERVEAGGDWQLTRRTDGKVTKTLPARELWDKIAHAAWASADPGLQFDTTINDWHTCPASGRINASNPCSEYMFLDDTACNLASLNLLAFRERGRRLRGRRISEHAVRLWTIVLEISVHDGAVPVEGDRAAQLRLPHAGPRLRQSRRAADGRSGIPYDSDAGRAFAAAITALLTGTSYATSAEMAGELGPFPGFEKNREAMLRVIRNHRRAAHGRCATAMRGWRSRRCRSTPRPARTGRSPRRRGAAWDMALALGEKHGFRNAQASVIAPTGTIGLVMDCDTTGIEPDFALVKFKKLAGGGYFKIINRARAAGLARARLRRRRDRRDRTLRARPRHAEGRARRSTTRRWPRKGFDDAALGGARSRRSPRPSTSSSRSTNGRLGEAFLTEKLGHRRRPRSPIPASTCLAALGFTRAEIDAANTYCCGAMTLEGAPHLTPGAPAGVRLRQPVRPHRHALRFRPRAISA